MCNDEIYYVLVKLKVQYTYRIVRWYSYIGLLYMDVWNRPHLFHIGLLSTVHTETR